MSQDSWVIDVLNDVRKFAEIRDHRHLAQALDHAIAAFLKDLAEHPEKTNATCSDPDILRDILAKLRKWSVH